MSVMFLGHHIPDSPFKVRVPPPSGDVGKLNIEQSFEVGDVDDVVSRMHN